MVRLLVRAMSVTGALLAYAATVVPASALSIELKDVAADRIERQRAAAEGALPLPGTPNVALLDQRLKEQGVNLSEPILIRIFKTESELEIWKQKSGAYVLFATYPICHWSGSTGPKLRSGDKQAPEGFYSLTRAQIRHVGRWPKSLDIGFPNIFDQSQARTGSSILVHGGCSSVGCFAMTNPVMDEIHLLASAAMDNGQDQIPVHVFPFRMTDASMKAQASSPWTAFWVNLKQGYDAFDKSKKPPRVSVCDGRYKFEDTDRAFNTGPITACSGMFASLQDQNQWLNTVPTPEAPKPVNASMSSEAEKFNPSAAMDLQRLRPTFNCPVSLPSCRRYLNAQHRFALKRAAWQSRGTGRRTWLAQDPPG